MKPIVYIETTVLSYLTARPSRDLIIAARQEITREVWSKLVSDFFPVISALVIVEATKGDVEAANKRLEVVKEIPVLQISDDAKLLAGKLIKSGVIPSQYQDDALHIAICALNGADYILTWNFAHMNNVFTKARIQKLIEAEGLTCPVICSPEELTGA